MNTPCFQWDYLLSITYFLGSSENPWKTLRETECIPSCLCVLRALMSVCACVFLELDMCLIINRCLYYLVIEGAIEEVLLKDMIPTITSTDNRAWNLESAM